LIAFLSSKNGTTSIPEYKMMKFCEMFHISPNEYYLIPSKTVDIILMMKNLESQFDGQRTKSSNIGRR
jgi:hypothetical protein